jgi:hypothetical protein
LSPPTLIFIAIPCSLFADQPHSTNSVIRPLRRSEPSRPEPTFP